ncbi:MAG: hypothetical protein BWY45_03258 [Euryarchaeota archaeon ADurb.Bin294]|nr:MAG: hypothetical protein BWY45_03258 [Euryarchaeota archaeon ADurb.Bin294]
MTGRSIAAIHPVFSSPDNFPRYQIMGMRRRNIKGGTYDATIIFSGLDRAPTRTQTDAQRNGKSGPQSTSFPVGNAVMGSNQAYPG